MRKTSCDVATEAKNIGANAVINVEGGRHMTAFPCAAAYVEGTAVRVEDPQALADSSKALY